MLLKVLAMAIQVLPDHVVAQIAAGEVVERPASVVKELVENALDAGAGHIRVSITGDGRRMIRISDDGSGIMSGEVEVAFARHATSKLNSVDDLAVIRTLGFRGEALASIASVSELSVTTRHASESMGTTLRIEGSRLIQRRSVGAPAGTVISVENLFYNTPARLKFLKSESTEKRQISTVILRYAMAYPQVRFVLEQDGREIFRSSGSGQLADVLVTALGLDEFKNMIEVQGQTIESEDGLAITVSGFASAPRLNRADRSRITLFVNGRWIQDTSLTYAVIQAYHTLLMTGRFPVAVLMIELPPSEVDVNVHPTKAEVRFRNADAVFSAIQRAVRRAVIDQAQTPMLRSAGYTRTLSDHHNDSWSSERDSNGRQMSMGLPLESPGGHARRGNALPLEEDADLDTIPEGPQGPARPRTLPMLRVVGQVGASYIVAEGPAGLYLVDQHAAHERILYEQFMEEYAREQQMSQHTLAAQSLQLSPSEARLIEDNLDVLSAVGFVLEPFGPNTFVIRSVPALLADADPLEVVSAIVDDLTLGNKPGHASVEDKIVLRVCKSAAVKAGQILSNEEMQALIRQLERCQSPLTCPHGRPTMIHLSSDQLAHEFGRI
jgi:DNA mismatch repair protein MutL